MENVENYNDLSNEESRLLSEIEVSNLIIDEGLEEILSLKQLFVFLKEELKENVKQDFHTENALKESLINLSLDFVYEKLTSKLTEDEDSSFSIKSIVKSILDTFYTEYKPIITDSISEFIDRSIEKLKQK